MTIRIHEPKLKTVYYVEYTILRNGRLKVCSTEHCDDLDDMRLYVANRGGSILQVGEPRQVRVMDVSF